MTKTPAKLDRSRAFGTCYGDERLHGQRIAYEQDGKYFNGSDDEIVEKRGPGRPPKDPEAAPVNTVAAPAKTKAQMPDNQDYESWRMPALRTKLKELTGKGPKPGTTRELAAKLIRQALAEQQPPAAE